MSSLAHRIYIASLVSIVVVITFLLIYKGVPYYSTSLEERFYHPDHDLFKPSGIFGHGLGIIGTLLVLIGVFGYIARKRYRSLARLGRLKYWLEFHIFLCTLGPIMILFHTAFKLGGIASVSFWSMVAVVASGVIGRFIYIQIPRTIEGRALNLQEIKETRTDLEELLKNVYILDESSYASILASTQISLSATGGNFIQNILRKYASDRSIIKSVKNTLRQTTLPKMEIHKVAKLVRRELQLNNRIGRLQLMQNLFKYWHVAHMPFAIIMLVFMVIHVGIVLAFGYKWIF